MTVTYKCLTFLNLPLLDIRKSPGDTVTQEQLIEAGQHEGNISQLIEAGVITDDLDAEIHEAHAPVAFETVSEGYMKSVSGEDQGEGVSDNA